MSARASEILKKNWLFSFKGQLVLVRSRAYEQLSTCAFLRSRGREGPKRFRALKCLNVALVGPVEEEWTFCPLCRCLLRGRTGVLTHSGLRVSRAAFLARPKECLFGCFCEI